MNNIKEMERKTTEIERKARKIGRKLRVYAVIGAIMLGVGLVFYAFYGVSKFYDENRVIFQTPIIIKLQTPIKIEKRVKEVKKAPTMPVQAIKEVEQYPSGFEQAYDKVWLMESGRGSNKAGLNGYCIAKGEINEIGYAPHDKYCFKDRAEQKSTFMTWLTNRINKVKMPWCETVSQCLTIYSSNAYSL